MTQVVDNMTQPPAPYSTVLPTVASMLTNTNSDGSSTLNYTDYMTVDNTTNTTTLPTAGHEDAGEVMTMPYYAQFFITVMYSAITVLGIGGNLIVIYIIYAYQRMRTVTNYFIVNLACGDFLMASLCIPFTFVANVLMHYWPFGSVMCPVVLYAQSVSVFLSAFTLVAISVDRYIAVTSPLRPRMTTNQAAIIISAIWILALSVPLPVVIKARAIPDEQRPDHQLCVESWSSEEHRYIFSLAIMCLQYFLPLFVLLFTYTRIGIVIFFNRTPGEAQNGRDKRIAASKRKMVKMMFTVVVIYTLCWLPLHTITLVGDRHDIWGYKYIQIIWIACHWLAMSCCCYNPMVYCWMNSTFRAGFKYVLRFLPCITLSDHPAGGSSTRGRCLGSETASSYVSTIRNSCLPDRRHGAGNGLFSSDSAYYHRGSIGSSVVAGGKNYKEMQIYNNSLMNGHHRGVAGGARTNKAQQQHQTCDRVTLQQHVSECEPLNSDKCTPHVIESKYSNA